MANTAALARVNELAGRIDAISDAIAAKDWPAAERLWAQYKRTEARHAAEIY